ncbi:methyltransferase domain-containing protein [Nitratireductor sp. GZWM139]|uniref:methyltransferase domain-containing protein n=1 Tax=Nitratireductor sp. GZWM139 TaxID=2950541 RepID=UPI0024BED5E3|nr:methyltransferase domain-containing protein [Nitratireductor sp. GZWM139]MDJ1463845.1 methyltransferase domain-containing protein [Nitratireductor sp. GZWM139]
MNPFIFTSGNLLADRRAEYAEMLLENGEFAAAAGLMGEALELAPDWIAGHYRHGEMLAEAGEIAAAVDAWRTVLRLDREDRLGAALKLELHGALDGLEAAPSAFVETLFDQYAETFDASLVDKLGYRVPQLLEEALLRLGRDSFAHAVDLGCGTGLMGERLRSRVSFLEGLDISAEMLKRAGGKHIYDRLERADLAALSTLPRKADLVTAADVFMYLGALERLFATAGASLAPGALFVFSVEHHAGPEAMVLRASRRYAHSEPHLRAALAEAGFEPVLLEKAAIRMDRGEPIEGLIVVAERTGAARKLGDAALVPGAKQRPRAH